MVKNSTANCWTKTWGWYSFTLPTLPLAKLRYHSIHSRFRTVLCKKRHSAMEPDSPIGTNETSWQPLNRFERCQSLETSPTHISAKNICLPITLNHIWSYLGHGVKSWYLWAICGLRSQKNNMESPCFGRLDRLQSLGGSPLSTRKSLTTAESPETGRRNHGVFFGFVFDVWRIFEDVSGS